MSLQQILGQEKAIRLIRKAINHERIPHAWLFSGMAHIGKYKTALALAQTLNCLENGDDACGHCDFCRQIEHEHFPDFRVVRPEGKNIRIAQVRDALDWLHLRPDRAQYRVLIFEDADQFNRESANAFLKTLEEPPPDTLIILINLNPQNLLETIVSRCQHIRFRPLSREMVLEILRAKTELSEDQLELLVSFGAGGVRSDLALQVELMQNIQDSVIGSLTDLSAQCIESMLQRTNDWAKSKNEEWRLVLDVLENWFRDLAWIKHHLPQQDLFHAQKKQELEQCSKRFRLEDVYQFSKYLAETRKNIELNANRTLALESLWIRLKHYSTV